MRPIGGLAVADGGLVVVRGWLGGGLGWFSGGLGWLSSGLIVIWWWFGSLKMRNSVSKNDLQNLKIEFLFQN
jgi:hypothetical protein